MCVGSTCTTSRTKPRLDVTVYEPRMTVEAPGVSGSGLIHASMVKSAAGFRIPV